MNNFNEKNSIYIEDIRYISKKIRYNQKPARITILKTRLSKSEKAFQCLIAKDLTNMSDKKYLSLRTIFKKINPIPLWSLVWVNELKFSLDKIFEINRNEKGYFFNPVQKLKFVIGKFLLQKKDFKDKLVRIKLSADVTKISKTRIQILNFAFELLDDKDGISNVNRIFVLGTFLI